jgi:hypothetical protein
MIMLIPEGMYNPLQHPNSDTHASYQNFIKSFTFSKYPLVSKEGSGKAVKKPAGKSSTFSIISGRSSFCKLMNQRELHVHNIATEKSGAEGRECWGHSLQGHRAAG